MVNWILQDISRFENASFNGPRPSDQKSHWFWILQIDLMVFQTAWLSTRTKTMHTGSSTTDTRGYFIYNHGTISIKAAYTAKNSSKLRCNSDSIIETLKDGTLFLFYYVIFRVLTWCIGTDYWIIIDIFSDWIWDFLTVNAGPDVLNICTFGGIRGTPRAVTICAWP